MAIITLNEGETLGFTLAGDNQVFGTVDGGETITIGGGSQELDGSFNAGGDTIVFTGAAAEYEISRSGSSLVITGPNGTVVTMPAPQSALTGDDNPVLRFSDVELVLDTVVNNGVATVTIGDQEVTADPQPIGDGGDPVPTTPTVTVTVAEGNVNEGDAIVYEFTLSEPSDTPVTINVSTVNSGANAGTATAGSDYTAVSTTITFAPGQTTQILSVSTINDTVTEPTESVVIRTTSATAGVVINGEFVAANIVDNDAVAPPPPPVPQSFELTTGADTFLGGAANDRISGVQNQLLAGKLLSQADNIGGGDGTDTLVLLNSGAVAPNVLDDVDFTNVTSVEVLQTNYTQVVLGAQAAEAGIVQVDTTASDTQNVGGGTLLDISDAAFTNELDVTMSNTNADLVITDLAVGADRINTGTSVSTPTSFANPIDAVQLVNQTNDVRITFTSTAVGDGNAFDGNGDLALTAQSEDGSDGLTGPVSSFDDEGIRFTGGRFDVRDVSGTQRGTFGEVVLGTMFGEAIFASGAGSYINAGMGDDFVVGTASADFLVGGGGDDQLQGGAGNDNILGGAGDDIITGGAGIDVMDGGEGSDAYVFNNGEFVAAEAVVDTGTGADDVDTLVVNSSVVITDAQFAGKEGFEALETNLTGTQTVTLEGNAEDAGITRIYSSNDDLDAGSFTADLTVLGFGDIETGSGNDEVTIQVLGSVTGGFLTADNFGGSGIQGYTGDVDLGDGDDLLNANYAIVAGVAGLLDGGDGEDTLQLGGLVGAELSDLLFLGVNSLLYSNPFNDNLVNFENVVIATAEDAVAADPFAGTDAVAGNAVSYDITVVDDNVEEGGSLFIDGSALRGEVVVDLGADGDLGTADDIVDSEFLFVDGTGLTGDRSLLAAGGGGNDQLLGGEGDDTLNGGDGTDRLEGNDGDDQLLGGAGDDILVGGLGDDLMDGGDGSDLYGYNSVAELVAGDVIVDGGSEADNDILGILADDSIEDAGFANKTGLEELRVFDVTAGTETVTLAGNFADTGIGTIRVLSNGNDDVDASGVGDVDLTVFTGSGGVITSDGDDEVLIARGEVDADGNPIGGFLYTVDNNSDIDLGAGDDILRTYFNTDYSAVISGGAGFDEIVAGSGYSIHTSGSATGNRGNENVVETVTLGADVTGFEQLTLLGGDAANEDANLEGNTIDFFVTLQNANVAGPERFIVDASGLTADVVTDAGTDGIVGTDDDGTTDNTLALDASTLSAGRALDVRGGAGDDEVISGAGADLIDGGAGDDVLDGGAGDDVIEGGEGDDVLIGGAGSDRLLGGAGDDTIVLNVTQFNAENDFVDGGEGTNTLLIEGTAAAQELADVGFNNRFFNIQELTLEGGPGAGNTAFTFNMGFFSQEAGLDVVNLGEDVDGTTINATNRSERGVTINDDEFDNDVTLIGSRFADTFNIQGGGDDVVRAGAGDDIVNGGAAIDGDDFLDGGEGNDTLNIGTATYGGQGLVLGTTTVGGVTTGITAFEVVNLAAGRAERNNTAPTADVAGTTNSYSLAIDNTAFASATGTITINAQGLRGEVVTDVGLDGQIGGGDDVVNTEELVVDGSSLTGARALVVNAGGGDDTLLGGAAADTFNAGAGDDTVLGGGGRDTINGGAGDDILLGEAGNDIINAGEGSDVVVGGAGSDTVTLTETVAARDTVLINVGDASRAAAATEAYIGFDVDTDTTAGLAATADVIDFGEDIIADVTASGIVDGVVQQDSVLGEAVEAQTTFLAALQLIEQELNGVAGANEGVIAFEWNGDTYIGTIANVSLNDAFQDVVKLTGVTGLTELVDVDGAGGLTEIGLIGTV
ncbi:beta strand repeat-containing protein [Sphingomonas baiyangensis]|uniref:Calx-beta domain-containing protein n=1 Tax=Sphingomonas baiyangensis TaxID=2572576 RepID=A0A4U1L4P7_9SPHN|nr:Calx-beta domain-containing protein [Sphingomonas baiyangensis]TKD51213.1 hypothetical protein FBR43_10940 [Sphingomonas baiyangensis]